MKQPLVWVVLGLTVAAGAVVFVGLHRYAGAGAPFLARLDGSVGEMLMKAAERFEAAGDVEGARARYLSALGTRFEGPQNRNFVERRLGALLLEAGEPGKAVPHLEAAARGPRAVAEAHERLCEALLLTEDRDALGNALDAWKEAAGGDAEQARYWYFLGRLAAEMGEYEVSVSHYEEGRALDPGSLNTYALGERYGKTDPVRADEYYVEFLLHGGTGAEAERARGALSLSDVP